MFGVYLMPRKKSGKPTKKHMCITVSAETRSKMDFLSELEQRSVSEIIAELIDKRAARAEKNVNAKNQSPSEK